MRARTNISLKDRASLCFSDFRGVDLSSSPLDVPLSRATDARNFISEYGVNCKRNGWQEMFRIEVDDEPQQINGVFAFSVDGRRELLIHAGRRFYRTDMESDFAIEDITESSTFARAAVDVTRLTDRRSQCFIKKGRAYIIGCGDYLVYGSWDGGKTYELRRVFDNEDTYIPTTTVSIDCDEVVEDSVRATLDDVNLLSSYRINQLLGRSYGVSTWTLDSGSVDAGSDVSVRIETLEEGEPVEYVLSNSGEDKTVLYRGTDVVGSVDFEQGKIKLTGVLTSPQIENRDNIFVTFRHTVEGYEDRITRCTFGTLFGVSGNTDRLFLAGNETFPNVDFHSEMDDYTYFGDRNTAVMGSEMSPIGGYAHLSDSTLAIFKENATDEADIFFRTGRYDDEVDAVSGVTETQAIFPLTAGHIGESVISRYACANFSGDNLMLSRNGIFGVVRSNNVVDAGRYVRERSRAINKRLLAHEDLSEAVSTVFEGRYYLAVDGVCYVADARYKYVRSDDVDGSYSYEWWYWDNIPVRVWAVIDGRLWFGSADGRVCVFDNEHADRTRIRSMSGDLALDIANNKMICREALGKLLGENDIVTIKTDGVYSLFAEDVSVEEGRIAVSEEEILEIFEGIEVYADEVGQSGLCVDTPYFIADVDRGLCTYTLADADGKTVALTEGGFRLHKLLSGREIYLCDVAQVSFGLKETRHGKRVTLSGYNDNVPTHPLAHFIHRAGICAEWYTPVTDLGTSMASKTLLKMTVVTEPGMRGVLSFGYDTKNASRAMSVRGEGGFSFEEFSFENFSFDTAFATSYTARVNQRNFNYIMFRIVSDNDEACAVNNFTVLYKINQNNKGVR